MVSKARVFVSCSQRKGTQDENFVSWLVKILTDRGFEPYVAIQEQTLRGLKENIFQQLASSDYFLFVDFKRDEISGDDSRTEKYRGSLFSHQELALAAYLDLDVLAFQEEGVIHTDGMLSILQANPIRFRWPMELVEGLLEKHLDRANWNPNNTRQLSISVHTVNTSPAGADGLVEFAEPTEERLNEPRSRAFLLAVHNNSRDRTALQCAGYLTRCIYEHAGFELDYELAELKWAAVPKPTATVNIFPGQKRLLDAVEVPLSRSDTGMMHLITDSSISHVHCVGEGTYLLEYTIVSVNFPEMRTCFRLALGYSIEKVQFEEVGCDELDRTEYPRRSLQFVRHVMRPSDETEK